MINNLQLRQSTATHGRSASRVDIKDLEMANKAAKTIEDLEKLLQQRTDELNQVQSDLEVFEQTALNLEQTRMQMEEDLEEAQGLLDQQAVKIMEQEQLIEKMGGQLRENEEFKNALAEQEIKDRMKENLGVTS